MVSKRVSILFLFVCTLALSSLQVTQAWKTNLSEKDLRVPVGQGDKKVTRKKAFRKGGGTRHRLQGDSIAATHMHKEKKCKHLKTKKMKKHHNHYPHQTHAPHEVYHSNNNGPNRDLQTNEFISTSSRGKEKGRKLNQILSTDPSSRGEPEDPFFHYHGTEESFHNYGTQTSFSTFKDPNNDDEYEYSTYWSYPYGYEPNLYSYGECEMPSMTPSVSLQPSSTPSLRPSSSPTGSPTKRPSSTPSLRPSASPTGSPTLHPSSSPSISHEPTLSHQPSVSNMPSNSMIPSASPSYDPKFCNAYKEDGTVTTTGYEVEGTFLYEMVTLNPLTTFTDFEELLKETNRMLGHLLTLELVCREESRNEADQSFAHSGQDEDVFFHSGGSRGLKAQNKGTMLNQSPENSKRSLEFIDGVEPIVGEVIVQCNPPEKEGQQCDQIKGNYRAYLRMENSLTPEAAAELILSTLEEIVVSGDILRMDNMGDIVQLAWGKGSIASMNPQQPISISFGEEPVNRRSITSTGISAIAAASVITIVFVYAASRKMKTSEIKTTENLIDDDASQFTSRGFLSEHTDNLSTSSSQKWRHDRDAHVVGEDDSVFSGTDNIMQDLAMFENGQLSKNNLGGHADALNVHSCTSATCNICRQKRNNPKFCRVDSLSPVVEIEEGGRAVEASIYDMMDLEPRSYQAPNTVSF